MKKLFKWLIIGAGLFMLIGVVRVAMMSPEEKAQAKLEREAAKTKTAAATGTIKRAEAPTAPAYKTISDTAKSMTDLQFDRYADSLKGSRVSWSGWVKEVRSKTFGGYEVWIDMDSPEEALSVQDVYIPIPENTAVGLQKKQPIAFDGIIERISALLGKVSVHIEEGAVIVH